MAPNDDLKTLGEWMSSDRFDGVERLHSPQQVLEQRGTIANSYPVAGNAAAQFHARLRELFAERKSITTFGPYSPGQAVTMKRIGIEGIYLGGWATSAKGSVQEDPGPDLASYPLSQVPDEAAPIVRALLTADKSQHFARSRMSEEQRASTAEVDYRPFIIADADTGHGGEAHVRNLVRRFVEVGVPGYHIEDQKPGVKKCGHQAGKVLVPHDEQNKRLNSARFQLDVMGVGGIVVARTDAEAATFLDGRNDERDQPFLLGATNNDLPSCKIATLAILRKLNAMGASDLRGHLLYRISDGAYAEADDWLQRSGITGFMEQTWADHEGSSSEPVLDKVMEKFLDTWQMAASLKTYGQAVADVMRFQIEEGASFPITLEEWEEFAQTASLEEARERARSMEITIVWDCELPRTPEGYYQIKGGIPYATARSLAAAPFCDILWMETKTADLEDARVFAEAIHAVYPDQMLAYNLSPSFNWDSTGMSDEEMSAFPEELGKMGFVFNFITYGGHQIDGLAAEEFATALQEDGMLALARLQRKFRLLNSPYKTPQSLVGGPRLDGALMGSTGHTATTKAMGKGSTQFQHLIQTEVPPSVLLDWLGVWGKENDLSVDGKVQLRPHTAGSEILELSLTNDAGDKVANVVFDNIQDRRGRSILAVRDENTYDEGMRRKRLMTLLKLFLLHRYKARSVHYLSPTEDNLMQAKAMKEIGIFNEVTTEVGQIIVAEVDRDRVSALVEPGGEALLGLIRKS
ncbi:MAG: isocitrate lyase ICL2 [Acidobacteriota bacterium]